MFYELLEDGTIGRSTPSEKVAISLGLTLQTDKEIIYAYDGKRYFKGEEPTTPAPTKEEISETRRQLFTEQADPLKYAYEECLARYGEDEQRTVDAKNEWLAKKDEIRDNNPYPVEASDETSGV